MIYISEVQQYRILTYTINFKSCWSYQTSSLFHNSEISFVQMDLWIAHSQPSGLTLNYFTVKLWCRNQSSWSNEERPREFFSSVPLSFKDLYINK